VLLSLWLVSAYAAGTIRPGEYVLTGDWGRLKIEQRDGGKNFSIDSIGANCHMCGLSGRLVGTTAETVEENPSDGDMVCRIRMNPSADGRQITVEPLTDEACRQFCGMRARFDGVYRKPQGRCTGAGQRNARDTFIRHYRAKRFNEAVAALRPLLEHCSAFLGWIEIDRVRNDLALAYFHAGNPEQCLATLRNTRAFEHADEAALRSGLPPCDFDNYLPTAQASWHNMRLCAALPRSTGKNGQN
jgi:hypothetical protein